MRVFRGVATPVRRPSMGVEVAVEFVSGYLVIMSNTGEWLGSWPAVNVTARELDDAHVMLELGKEQIRFESTQPQELIDALGSESHYFRLLSGWQKTARRARMSLARFDSFIEISARPGIDQDADSPMNPPIPTDEPKSLLVPEDDRQTAFPEGENVLQAEVNARQEEALEWIASAMRSWFDYFFVLSEGSIRDRLQGAADGLEQSSKGLRIVSESLEGLVGENAAWADRLSTYCTAVAAWADAFEIIALGARLDQRPLAQDGFAKMQDASEMAENVVAARSKKGHQVALSGHLKALGEFRPSKSVPRRTIEKARAPWRRALTAAGSPFNWNRSFR